MKNKNHSYLEFITVRKVNIWFLLPVAIIISELLTILFSEIYSYIFLGTHLTKEYLFLGMWDSGFVSLIGVSFLIFIMDQYRMLREKYIALHEENKTRKEYAEQLNISEKRYRVIFEQAALGIFNLDKQGRFLKSNKRFCDMLGYSEEELTSMTYLDVTHDDYRAIFSPSF